MPRLPRPWFFRGGTVVEWSNVLLGKEINENMGCHVRTPARAIVKKRTEFQGTEWTVLSIDVE